MSDSRDLLVMALADTELAAIDTAGGWRELALAGIDLLREREQEIERLTARLHHLLDELRADREDAA